MKHQTVEMIKIIWRKKKGEKKDGEAGWPLIGEREFYFTWLNDWEFEVIEIKGAKQLSGSLDNEK